MSKHTPGPWSIRGPRGGELATVHTLHATLEAHDIQYANARLIASAPDLLEACDAARREIMKLHQCWYNDRGLMPSMNVVALMLEDVIDKARGRASETELEQLRRLQ